MKQIVFLCYFLVMTLIAGCKVANGEKGNTINFSDISLVESLAIVEIGTTYTPLLSPTPPDDLKSQLVFTSESPNIATVSNGIVTGKSVGRTTIKISHPSYSEFKILTVEVIAPTIKKLTITPQVQQANSGDKVTIDISAIDSNDKAVSVDALKAISWSGDLIPAWDEASNSFKAQSYETGTYIVTGTLGGASQTFAMTFAGTTYRGLTYSQFNMATMSVSDTGYISVFGTMSDGSVKLNPTLAKCSSSDSNLLTVTNPPTNDGFKIRAYSSGTVTISCYLGEYTAKGTMVISTALATSWITDEDNTTDALCSSYKCTMNFVTKRDDGGALFLVETPGDTFRLLYSRAFGNTMSYNSSLSMPSSAHSSSGNVNTSYSSGLNGASTINYTVDSKSDEDTTTTNKTAIIITTSNRAFDNASVNIYSSRSGSLTSRAFSMLGDGYAEANIEETLISSGNNDRYEYKSTLYQNGTTEIASPINSSTTQYIDLLTSVNTANSTFGQQANSYFTLSSSHQTLTQTFLFSYNQTDVRTIDLSVCGYNSSTNVKKRLFIRQTHFPSNSTTIICVTNTSMYSWIYDDDSSNRNVYNSAYSALPSNWTNNIDSVSGLSYIGSDAISDTFGSTGNLSVMGYIGYDGTSTNKNHYGFILEGGTLTPIYAQAVIGIQGEPYIYSNLLESSDTDLNFNFVATSTTRELWTPYGILGKRTDMTNFSMNIGKAPFESAEAVPFTYSYRGKKRLALLNFGIGDADKIKYGYLLIFNSDLNRLPR